MNHILNILATWRLMELIQSEDAPFGILEQFRKQIYYDKVYAPKETLKQRISKEMYDAIECDWCLSIWCGLFVALCTRQNFIFGLAYSAGALFVKIGHQLMTD